MFKTITIKKEVYDWLTKEKQEEESFTDLFARLLREKRPSLWEFYGAWKISTEEEKEIRSEMNRARREFEESFKSHETP